jgi:hypothetical protein
VLLDLVDDIGGVVPLGEILQLDLQAREDRAVRIVDQRADEEPLSP